jgi:hypothetical protein
LSAATRRSYFTVFGHLRSNALAAEEVACLHRPK